jgi:bacterial/archaeal transporter family-2 protein
MDNALMTLALLAGAVLPVQAGANAQLSKRFGCPFTATTLQLLVGTAVLLIVATLGSGLDALLTLPHVPWWHAMGGLASALYVVSGILLFPRLGAIVTMGLFIAGQMLASLLLDVYGLLGITPKLMTWAMLIGTLAILIGTAGIVFGQAGGHTLPLSKRFGSILLGLTAGAILPVQGAINSLLRHDLHAPLAVGITSFVVATLAMAPVLLFSAVAIQKRPEAAQHGLPTIPWWSWIGGVAGAYYVMMVFIAIPLIGAATTVGLTIAGQQLASLLVDRYGLLCLPQRPISAVRMAGVFLLLIGVALIRVF